MKKLFSLLLVLILILSALPVTAFAFSPDDYVYIRPSGDKWLAGKPTESGYPIEVDITEEYLAYLDSLAKADDVLIHTDPRDHDLGWNCNTKYHWKECACGARFGEELHVDPLDTDDNYCICGYHFSDNADLVTLWVKGCPGIKYFNKNTTEYNLKAYTYKDVKEIKIATRTHDSEATVELPEDLTLKQGENKFEVKVTSESKKVTKTYTLIITKE